jgi:hypothetical protein
VLSAGSAGSDFSLTYGAAGASASAPPCHTASGPPNPCVHDVLVRHRGTVGRAPVAENAGSRGFRKMGISSKTNHVAKLMHGRGGTKDLEETRPSPGERLGRRRSLKKDPACDGSLELGLSKISASVEFRLGWDRT